MPTGRFCTSDMVPELLSPRRALGKRRLVFAYMQARHCIMNYVFVCTCAHVFYESSIGSSHWCKESDNAI